MTSGGDGMIVTNSDKFSKDLKILSYYGWDQDPFERHKKSLKGNKNIKHWNYSITKLGFKYNMTDLMASIGLVQLRKLRYFNKTRLNIIKFYTKKLKNSKNSYPAFPYTFTNSSYWMFIARCKKRDKLINYLKSKNCHNSLYKTFTITSFI